MADKDLRVEHAGGEHLGGSLEAVQHRHGPGDGDLLVVDAVRLDGHAGGRRRDAELEEGPAGPDPADAVLDGGLVAGRVDDDLPALRPVELVGARGGRGAAQELGR